MVRLSHLQAFQWFVHGSHALSLTQGSRMGEAGKGEQKGNKVIQQMGSRKCKAVACKSACFGFTSFLLINCHLAEFWWRIRGLCTRSKGLASLSVHKTGLGANVQCRFQCTFDPRAALKQMQHSNIIAQVHRKHSIFTAGFVINKVTKHTQNKTYVQPYMATYQRR